MRRSSGAVAGGVPQVERVVSPGWRRWGGGGVAVGAGSVADEGGSARLFSGFVR